MKPPLTITHTNTDPRHLSCVGLYQFGMPVCERRNFVGLEYLTLKCRGLMINHRLGNQVHAVFPVAGPLHMTVIRSKT